MDGQELAAMYADFERWMPEWKPSIRYDKTGDFWFDTDSGEPFVGLLTAPIESAVLDELERRGFCVQVSAWGVIVGNGFTGDGPTRLHRLHAACLAAFGTEARP